MHKCLIVVVLFFANFITAQASVTFRCDSILAYKITVVAQNADGLWYSIRDVSRSIQCEQSIEVPFENFQLTDLEIAVGGSISIECPLLGVHLVLNQQIEDHHVYNVTNDIHGRCRYCLEEQVGDEVRPVDCTTVSRQERVKKAHNKNDLPMALIGMFDNRHL